MRIIIVIFALGILLFFTNCIFKRPVLKCPCKEELIEEIRQIFNADSVFMGVGFSPEIPYQPELKAINLTIINGTTNTMDFKSYITSEQSIADLNQMKNALKKEIATVANLVYEKCNSEKFNTIVVYFSQYDRKGRLTIIHQCWYDEELFPEKWERDSLDNLINRK